MRVSFEISWVAVRSANRKTSSRVDRDTRRHSGMATGTSHSQRRRRFTSPGRREASAARPVRAAAASVDTTPIRDRTQTENSAAYTRVEPLVRQLTERMGLPMPKLWLIPQDSPNAFATGRDPAHASLAFTAGLLILMSDSELQGVIAHELGH